MRLKPKKIRFQHGSKLSKADIRVSRFRWQIVPDSRSINRKVSAAKTEERRMFCSWLIEGDAVSKKLDIIRQVLRGLTRQ